MARRKIGLMLGARLFGGLAVEVDGRPIGSVPGLKPRSLLAWLLLHPGQHPRARLAGRFWPDVLDTSARASLRSALWTVRSALEEAGGGGYLRADRAGAGIDPDLPRAVDAEEFDRLAAAGDEASLQRAVALADGPLLADLADEWALAAQDDYRERLVGILERLADAAERRGDTAGAVAWTRRALEQDRLRESAHRALMRRLAAAGERAGALEAYRRCRAVLAAELGLAPSAETRELAESLRAGDAREPPPPPPPARRSPPPSGPPFTGRLEELDALVGAWEGARAGRGGAALVSGEAGIGKTRLVAEAGSRALAEGARVALGGALELDGGPPFAPWSEALRELIPTLPSPPAAAGWPADLARLSPAVGSSWERPAARAVGPPDLERARLFEAVVSLADWATRDRPLLILLEDLHLADPASLALLAYVGRRLPGLPVLVVATRRDAAGGPELEGALDALRRRDALRLELRLGPLDPDDLRTVVRAAAPGLDPHDEERVVSAAEGNPLLACEGARAAAGGQDPAVGLRRAVRGPLGSLPEPARLLVELAAAAGRPLAPGEAAALVGADELPGALDAAWAADLLDPGDERRVRFVHGLVREACYAELAPARRAWLHGRLAEALAHRPGRSSAEVARHLRLAGDDGGARLHLAAAAEEARALGAFDAAADALREAVELAGADDAAAAELWLALAEAEAWRGRREDLDHAFGAALAGYRATGDLRGEAAAWEARGRWLRTTVCYPRESLAAYGSALDALERGGIDAPELRAVAMAGAAWDEAMAGDAERVEGLIAAVEAVPEAGGDTQLAAELELARAAGLIRGGRFAEAEAPSERAASLALASGRPDLACAAWVNVASAAACRGDFLRALDLATRAAGVGAQAGPQLEAATHAARAYALARLGRGPEALEAAGEQLAVEVRRGSAEEEARATFDLGAVLLATGDPAAAAERLAAGLAGGGQKVPRPLGRLLRAEALVRTGDADGAEAELTQVPFEPVGPADLPDTLVARLSRMQGLVAAARGDRELALRRLGEAEEGWRRRMAGVGAGEAYAANLADLGRPPVAGLVEPGLELGRVLAERATLLAEAGRDEEARAAAAEAAELADAVGYDGDRERLAALLGEGAPRAATVPRR